MSTTQIPDAHGSGLSFGGVYFTNLTGWRVQSGSVTLHDVTSLASPVVGSAGNSRVQRQFDAVSVEPDTVDVTALGPASFAPSDKGTISVLVLAFPDGTTIFGNAALVGYEVTGQVGELIRTSMQFKYVGY